jgi:hypothetical protein
VVVYVEMAVLVSLCAANGGCWTRNEYALILAVQENVNMEIRASIFMKREFAVPSREGAYQSVPCVAQTR